MIDLETARKVIAAAEKKAAEIGQPDEHSRRGRGR